MALYIIQHEFNFIYGIMFQFFLFFNIIFLKMKLTQQKIVMNVIKEKESVLTASCVSFLFLIK